MNIYEEIISDVKASGIFVDKEIAAERICVGVHYTCVKLSNGKAGLCCSCAKDQLRDEGRDEGKDEGKDEFINSFSGPAELEGKPALELAGYAGSSNILKSVIGAATLNALMASMPQFDGDNFANSCRGDTLSLLNIKSSDTVSMVGAFPPYTAKLKGLVKKLYVIDKDPDIEICEGFPVVRGEEAYKTISGSDVVIITAVTFANATLEGLLEILVPGQRAALVGPSVAPYAAPFFKRGITLLSGSLVTDSDKAMSTASCGGNVHALKNYARKINILKS
ncbi:MAG: DUF364 domain-containing protein [Firmicutes bacterium]|nr:DUF364 domain-containing protein [Bacillota bacterium]